MMIGEEVGGPEAALEVDRMKEVAADEETAIVVIVIEVDRHADETVAAAVAVIGAGTEGHLALVPDRVRVPAREIETGTDAPAHREIVKIDTGETEGVTKMTETTEVAIAQDVEEGIGRVVVVEETETTTEITATKSVRKMTRILMERIIRTITTTTMATSNLTSKGITITMMLVAPMAAITTGAWMSRRMRPRMMEEGKLIKSQRRMLQEEHLPHRLKTSSLLPKILKIKNLKSLQQCNKSKKSLKRLPRRMLLPRNSKRLKSLKEKLQLSSSSKSEK